MTTSNISKMRIDPAAIAAAIAAAPDVPVFDPDNPPRPWGDDAIISHSLQDLREQLAVRRTRGPGKEAAKVLTTLRLPPETLARWRASGKGWRPTRLD
jgi:predicted RNA-binding Zn ribbon-like protein